MPVDESVPGVTRCLQAPGIPFCRRKFLLLNTLIPTGSAAAAVEAANESLSGAVRFTVLIVSALLLRFFRQQKRNNLLRNKLHCLPGYLLFLSVSYWTACFEKTDASSVISSLADEKSCESGFGAATWIPLRFSLSFSFTKFLFFPPLFSQNERTGKATSDYLPVSRRQKSRILPDLPGHQHLQM